MIGTIVAAIPVIKEIIDRFVPDANKALELQNAIEVKLIEASTMQQQINMKEAEHASMFVAGWRPFIGWVCGAGCAYSFIAQPFLTWISVMLGGPAFISLDTAALMSLLLGMLGLGGLRTYEKVQGVERNNGIVMKTLKKMTNGGKNGYDPGRVD